MSSRTILSDTGNLDRTHSRFIIGTVAGLIVLLGVAFAAVHVMTQLDSMAASLARVNSTLDTLKTMDRKLDKLSGVSRTLEVMNARIAVTNRSLDRTNRTLSEMAHASKTADASLSQMRGILKSMQGDIHTMSHKISGSFLFRSIK